MNLKELEKTLKQVKMNKILLANELGIKPETIYRWDSTPQYVDAYLKKCLIIKELIRLMRSYIALMQEDTDKYDS